MTSFRLAGTFLEAAARLLMVGLLWAPALYAQNWVPVTTIGSVVTYSVVEHQGAMYASTDSLVYISTDGGDVWSKCTAQPAVTDLLNRLEAHGPYLYVCTLHDGLFRTDDSGQTWESYSTGLPALAIVGLAVLGDSLYCGIDGSGVYVRRLSTSTSWAAFNTGLPVFGTSSLGTSGSSLVAGIALSFFVRPQGGATWTEVSIDSTGAQRPIHETLTQGAYLFAATDRGVYRSGLDAESWEKSDIQALPDADIVALAIGASRLYAGLNFSLQHWIWYSDDSGDTWQVQAHEFAELLDLTVAHTRLWAARTDGLWHLDVATRVGEPDEHRPEVLELGPSRPNPFNASAVVVFSLSNPGSVRVRLYDALGRQVATLHDGFLPAGEHEVRWDGRTALGREAASGVYLCRLEVSGESATRKMLLLR